MAIHSIFLISTLRLLQKLSLTQLSLSLEVFLVSVYSCSYSFPSKVFTLILRACRQMPFRITTKDVLQFTSRRRTVDSVKKKLKASFWKAWFAYGLADYSIHQLVYSTDDSTEGEWKCFLFWLLCYKRNGKRCSWATIELWMHLGGLLSTQEARVALASYASFVLSNFPRASMTRWLHAARLPFLNCEKYRLKKTNYSRVQKTRTI